MFNSEMLPECFPIVPGHRPIFSTVLSSDLSWNAFAAGIDCPFWNGCLLYSTAEKCPYSDMFSALCVCVCWQWNLVCDSAWKVHIAKFSLLVGSIFGYLVMGVMADWYVPFFFFSLPLLRDKSLIRNESLPSKWQKYFEPRKWRSNLGDGISSCLTQREVKVPNMKID